MYVYTERKEEKCKAEWIIRIGTTLYPPKMRRESWISCTVLSLLQWNLACDVLMALAIKYVYNLPPHLSYDVTQKPKCNWQSEAEACWYFGLYSSGHHCRSHWPVANMAACMWTQGKGTSLRTSTVISHTTGSFQNNSHYQEEDSITFLFLCNVRWCS